MTLPIDRTQLALVNSNQNPGNTFGSAPNKNAMTNAYNTIDELYNFATGLISAGTLSRLGIINVMDYGASGSAQTFTGSIPAGSNRLTLTTGAHDFVSGQGISIPGAGVAGATLVTTVSNVQGSTLTVATVAETIASSVTVKHDDTLAIQKAIDAAPAGSRVVVPFGSYMVSDTILITKPILLTGLSGMYSKIVVSSSMSSTTDVFKISPNTTYRKELSCIEWLYVTPESGSPARHALHIDVSNSGQFLSKFTLQNCYFDQLGGNGIKLTNPTNVDGFFTSEIKDNLIHGGMNFQRIGDSVYIHNNTITGNNVGIEMSAVTGAVSVVIRENNITNKGGALKIDSGSQIKILYNQIEQVTSYTGSVDAMIYLGPLQMPEIIGNNINARNNVKHNIRLNGTVRTAIDKNILRKGTDEIIRIDSGSVYTDVKYNNLYINTSESEISPSVLNSGIATRGVDIPLSLENGYTAANPTTFNTPSVVCDSNGMVSFKGRITPGTRTKDTIIFTLPAGCRPRKSITMPIGYSDFTSSKTETMLLLIEPTGSVRVNELRDTATLHLDNVHFAIN